MQDADILSLVLGENPEESESFRQYLRARGATGQAQAFTG
jgi:hypothetical protein